MTIESVAEGDPVAASAVNQLIANVNTSPGRQVFTSNGTFTVPDGVHRFKVTLCGGGGGGFNATSGGGGEDSYIIPGNPGARSPTVSVIVSGQDIGSSFGVTVGAGGGGNGGGGGTSSFGTLISVSGGSGGSQGSASGSLAGSALWLNGPFQHSWYDANTPRPFGGGGAGGNGFSGGGTGAPGIVIVEW